MMSEAYIRAALKLRIHANEWIELSRRFPDEAERYRNEAARVRNDVRDYLDRGRRERAYEAYRSNMRISANDNRLSA